MKVQTNKRATMFADHLPAYPAKTVRHEVHKLYYDVRVMKRGDVNNDQVHSDVERVIARRRLLNAVVTTQDDRDNRRYVVHVEGDREYDTRRGRRPYRAYIGPVRSSFRHTYKHKHVPGIPGLFPSHTRPVKRRRP